MITTNQTSVDYCYKELKKAIIKGDLQPGQKLLIAKLAALLNTGPTPIREALSRLSTSGLVETKSNCGFFVKNISENEIRDIYETFKKIEILALEQAIDRGDSAWEANILAKLYQLAKIEKGSHSIDIDSWLFLNYEFHVALISACNSPCLLKIREDLYQLFERYCYLSFIPNKKFINLNHKEHVEIAKAVIERNKVKACNLTTLHLEKSLNQVLIFFNKRA